MTIGKKSPKGGAASAAVPTPKYRAELSADGDVSAGWRVVDDDGLLCMYCSQSEAAMIAEACNNYHALQQRAAALEAREKVLTELLGLMYDKWENGDNCYEEPEDFRGFLGKAFNLTSDEERRILAALAAGEPRSDESSTKFSRPEGAGDAHD